MAGSGQHFIPQHFQKPFVIPDGSDKLWMYRRDQTKPVPVGRKDAAKQHNFYSKPSVGDVPTLDDLITDYEHHVFALVDELRSLSVGQLANAGIVAEVAAHLSIRSAHTRTFIVEGAKSMAEVIWRLVDQPNELIDFESFNPQKAPLKIQELIHEGVVNNGIDRFTGISVETIGRALYFELRENGARMLKDAKASMLPYIEQFMFKPRELARAAHVKALSESLAPEGVIKKLKKLEWKIVDHSSNPAILPDCVCISLDKMEGWQPLFLSGKDPLLVVFPLAPDRLLVGAGSGCQEFIASTYNQAASSVCLDFFLSSERCDELTFRQATLGDQLRIKITDVIDESLAMAVQDILPQDSIVIPDVAETVDTVEPNDNETLSFTLSLQGFGNDEFANELVDRIQQEILRLLPREAFHRIEGFTFASNYEEALNCIDRGFKAPPLKTIPSEFGTGVAMPITVRRNGVIKTHFVLRDFLALQMMKEDPQERAPAWEILSDQLASTYLHHLTFRKFPEQMLSRLDDAIEQFLYQAANGVFDSYFSGRICATEYSDFDQAETLLNDQIHTASDQIVKRRRLYRDTGELDDFISYTLSALNLVMKSSARLIGMYHSCENPKALPEYLQTTLKDLEMMSWYRLFEKDLEDFFLNIKNWSKFDDILFTNRHLERWLLRFGVLLDLQENDGIYIHVPLNSDADYLAAVQTITSN